MTPNSEAFINVQNLHIEFSFKGNEHVNTGETHDDEFFFLFLKLGTVSKNSIAGMFTHIWHLKRVGIIATTFKKRRIHFNTDAAVRSSLLNLPYNKSKLALLQNFSELFESNHTFAMFDILPKAFAAVVITTNVFWSDDRFMSVTKQIRSYLFLRCYVMWLSSFH